MPVNLSVEYIKNNQATKYRMKKIEAEATWNNFVEYTTTWNIKERGIIFIWSPQIFVAPVFIQVYVYDL